MVTDVFTAMLLSDLLWLSVHGKTRRFHLFEELPGPRGCSIQLTTTQRATLPFTK